MRFVVEEVEEDGVCYDENKSSDKRVETSILPNGVPQKYIHITIFSEKKKKSLPSLICFIVYIYLDDSTTKMSNVRSGVHITREGRGFAAHLRLHFYYAALRMCVRLYEIAHVCAHKYI